MAPDPFQGDEELANLAFAALDRAIACIEDADAGPLIPFAMTHKEGHRRLHRFVGADYANDVNSAVRFASCGAFDCWAVAWDGHLMMGGQWMDAVFLQASRCGGEQAIVFAWRYNRQGPAGSLRGVGAPVFLRDAAA